MANLVEAEIRVKMSTLVKDDEVHAEITTVEFLAQIEAIIEELLNDKRALIEVTTVK